MIRRLLSVCHFVIYLKLPGENKDAIIMQIRCVNVFRLRSREANFMTGWSAIYRER